MEPHQTYGRSRSVTHLLFCLSLLAIVGAFSACDGSAARGITESCAGVTCSDHGTCFVEGNAANCHCDVGYYPEDLSCLPDSEPPTQPTDLVAEFVKNNHTLLTWTSSTDKAGVSNYRVYRRIGNDGEFAFYDTSQLSAYDDRAAPDSTDPVFYVVTAVDPSGNESSRSNEASVPTNGSLTGKVISTDGPIAKLAVVVYAERCFIRELGRAVTDDGGVYRFDSLPASEVFVLAYPSAGTETGGVFDYGNAWWRSSAPSADCTSAEGVTVLPGEVTNGIDFILPEAATLQGQVTFEGTPAAGLAVEVWVGDCQSGNWDGSSASSDTSGNFTVRRLPPGTIRVKLSPDPTSPYAEQWWDGSSGATSCDQAVPIELNAGESKGEIDFALSLLDLTGKGSVSGTVTFGGQAIEGLKVVAYGGPCGTSHLGAEALTDVSGAFTINNLAAGQVYLEACATCRFGYSQADAWWDGQVGSGKCTDGIPLTVAPASPVTGIDFALVEGGTVSGTVSADGIPIGGVLVSAYQERCEKYYIGAATTDVGGKYTIANLPAGSVFVRSSTENQPQIALIDEYYDEGQGTSDCNLAAAVSVSAGQTTSDIDLHLEQ